MDLQNVMGSVDVSTFFSDHFGREYLHVSGEAGRFHSLLPWHALNLLLRTYRPDANMRGEVVLAKGGENPRVPVDSRGLTVAELTGLLRDGATLIVNGVDRSIQPLNDLARTLELTFKTYVHANVYFGSRCQHGFDVHWDEHDTLILQIAGSKDWKIYGETTAHPIRHSSVTPPPPPNTDNPVWEGTLEDGDALYIPRGWWHVATPREEPTLHITLGITNHTGLSLLNWIGRKLEEQSAAIRADIPRFREASVRRQYLETFRSSLYELCTSPDLLEQFLEDSDAALVPWQEFSLPWSATPYVLPANRTAVISLTRHFRQASQGLSGLEIEYKFGGKGYSFNQAAAPLFDFLATTSEPTIDDFYRKFENDLSQDQLKEFLTGLVMYGLVSVSAPTVGIGAGAIAG